MAEEAPSGQAKRGRGRRTRKEETGEEGAAPVVAVASGPGTVPKDFKVKIKKLLQGTGPLMQSKFVPEWKKLYPDTPLDVTAWGFERLTGAMEAMADMIVITKDGTKKAYLSLVGGPAPELAGAAAAPVANGAVPATISRVAMSGVLAGVVASKTSDVDPAQLEAFMKQPKLQFTIDCLVEEFAKFSAAAPAAKAKPKKPRKPRPPPAAPATGV